MNWIARKMDESTLFFDSYAIIESIKGNPNYKKYENVKMVTTKLNLFEVCYFLIRDFGEEKAREFIEEHIDSVADFDVNVILYAAKLKLHRKKETLSMVDCIGY